MNTVLLLPSVLPLYIAPQKRHCVAHYNFNAHQAILVLLLIEYPIEWYLISHLS